MAADAPAWPWTPYQALAIKAECYETPEWAADAILDVELLVDPVVDPCCGRGILAEAAAERGHRVEAFDLYDWGYGRAGVDFLTWRFADRPPSDDDIVADERVPAWSCLMHPPASRATEFAAHALRLGARKLLLFQPLALWQNRRHAAFWSIHPPARIHVCEGGAECWRIDIAPAARRYRTPGSSSSRASPPAP